MRQNVLARLAIVAFIGVTASAVQAEVILFFNPPPGQPGHFSWLDPESPWKGGDHFLDITNAAADQTRETGETVFDHLYNEGAGASYGTIRPISGGVFRRADSELEIVHKNGADYVTWYIDAPCGLVVSENVGTFHNFLSVAEYGDGDYFFGGLPGNTASYVGVRFMMNGNFHYGWLLIDHGNEYYDIEIDLVAWAYETQPNTPIAAGAPDPCCLGDLNTSPEVDVFDLFILLDAWGTDGPGADLAAPFDVVDVFDLFAMLENWGACAP